MSSDELIIKLRSTPYLVAYLSLPECKVCKVLKPRVRQVVSEIKLFEFVYINLKEHPIIRGQYLVFAVPTIIILHRGKEIHRFSRFISIDQIEKLLKKISENS